MVNSDFAIFILTHGRPGKVHTFNTLKRCGYTGNIYIVVDNEDQSVDEYLKLYGKKVIVFDKKVISETFDEGDNFEDRRAIIYARNVCFKIAKNLGLSHFLQLDDDYNAFSYMFDENDEFKQRNIKDFDRIVNAFVEYLNNCPIDSLCFLQRGDLMGGATNFHLMNGYYPFIKRKAMNSFFCSTNKPFTFIGKINEDVNTYTKLGSIGKIFMSIPLISLNQQQTQSNSGGMTELYLDSGTYVKSFYTVMYSPSCTKIKLMGPVSKRLHHSISWKNAVPCIIRERNKK